MAARYPDRRVRRTRRRLKEALLELLGERDLDEISIREIADVADVGRSTFYSHYASKEELLFADFDRWLLSLAEAESPEGDRPDSGRRFRFSLPFLRHIREQRRFFLATFVRGGNARVRGKITELLAAPILKELERLDRSRRRRDDDTTGAESSPEADATSGSIDDAATHRQARARCIAGAFLELATWWLTVDDDLAAEQIDGVFQGLLAL